MVAAASPFLLSRRGWLRWGLFALAVAGGHLRAAPAATAPYVTRRWMVEDGLPDDTINRLVFDARGVMWLATPSGLARFDGRDFREFPLPRLRAIRAQNVRALAVSGDTLLMLPATGGLIEWRQGAFAVHPATALLRKETLTDLHVAPDGALWLGTSTGTLIRWDRGRLERFGKADGITHRGNRFHFATDAEGRTWVAADDFLGYYRRGKLVRYPTGGDTGLVLAAAHDGGVWLAGRDGLRKILHGRVTNVCRGRAWRPLRRAGLQVVAEAPDRTVWIGTRRQGLFRLVNGRPVPVALPYRIINAIASDRDGDLWIGTGGGGLFRLSRRRFTLLDASSGFGDDVSTGVCEDADGALWCANRSGGALRYAGGVVERIAPPRPGDSAYAICVCPDKAGNVWVGTSHGLYRVPIHDRVAAQTMWRSGPSVHVLFCAHDGALWVGTGDGKLYRFADGVLRPVGFPPGAPVGRIIALAEDSSGRIWLGADGGQLWSWRRGVVRRALGPGGLGREISCLDCDGGDNLWIGTSDGLVLKSTHGLHVFTAKEGLPDTEIAQVLDDGAGRLWCGSRRGIFSVEKSDLLAVASGRAHQLRTTVLGADDGLYGASALTGGEPMAWRGRRRLWFATRKGIIGFDPHELARSRPPPPLYLDRVRVDGRPVPTGPRIAIGSGAHDIGFELLAPDYATPEAVRIRHQLVGFDRDWQETPVDRRVSYAGLPPGDYVFRAEASRVGEPWPARGTRIEVVVTPTWTQTAWFQAALVLAGAAAIGLIVRAWSHRRLRRRVERLEREQATERERARIARNLHDDLGSSLTQIGMLADRMRRHATDPTLRSKLALLAGRTRRAAGELESIVWTVNPGNNTWDRLAGFVRRFAQSYCHDAEIACEVTGAELVPATPLSPEVQHNILAVVKESLNNIVKHAGATKVQLTFRVEGSRLRLEIADNGGGFDVGAPGLADRNGLTNMRVRMAAAGGTVTVESHAGTGTVVRLDQPLRPHPTGEHRRAAGTADAPAGRRPGGPSEL